MTQVFDQETGVLTPVTVIQAGPCPVVCVRTHGGGRLRRRAARVRRGAGAEAHEARARPPEEERRRRRTGGSSRSAGRASSRPARPSPSRRSSPARRSRSPGVSIGKGFQGTIKRHNFSRGPVTHGSHNVRKPGSVGASATPSRVFKGMQMAGQMGAQAVHPASGSPSSTATRSRTSCSSRAPSRAPRTAIVVIREDALSGRARRHRCSTRRARRRRTSTLDADRLRRRGQAAPRPRGGAGRGGRARAGTRGAKSRGLVAGGRSKPWRQKGTGRARAGTTRAPQWTGGGVAFPPSAAQLRPQGQPQGAQGRAPRSALRPRRSAGTLAVVDGGAFDGALDARARPRFSPRGARSCRCS